ncbi:MAG: ribosomal protein L7/L12 [Rhodospirillales bacterium]|nr:ribosomal protein L7/L12 [Rhodospirillales bacterium]
MDTPPLQKLLDDIKAQIAAGNKITAIKLYREATGAGLAEAKEAVELIAAGKPPPSGAAPSPSADAMQEVSALVTAGKKIEAIRVYRTAAGVDLKDAKDVVDALEAKLNPAAVQTRDAAMRRFRRLVVSGLVVTAIVAVLAYVLTRA